MLDKTTIAKLIDRAPLAVIVIGVLVFVIGAAGGLPIGNPPLQVTDLAWRAGLGVMGLILVTAGLLLISRESGFPTAWNPKVSISKYGIKIESPREGAQVGESVDVFGSYTVKPPDHALRLFTIVPDGGSFWPQAIAQFDAADKKWRAKVKLSDAPRYAMFIVAAIVDGPGQALWNYYYKLGEMTNWTPIDGPFSSCAFECARVWVERV